MPVKAGPVWVSTKGLTQNGGMLFGACRSPRVRYKYIVYVYIYSDSMSKLIAVSDELYNELTKMKGKMSYTETIKSLMEKRHPDIMKLAGLLTKEEGEAMERKVFKDRRRNFGRKFKVD